MDKKLIAALAACLLGFAVFLWLAARAASGGFRGKAGAVTDGRRVKYSAETVEGSATREEVSSATSVSEPPASDDAFVRVTDYIPTIRVRLAYAGKRNFTGRRIYEFQDAYLRYGTVKKLAAAQEQLESRGMGLLIWDAFRPAAAQQTLWDICPNPLYVSDPSKGYSAHVRGNAVDVTLVDPDGMEMVMPTEFDNFTKLADRDYSDVTDAFAVDNVKLLESIMKECGFKPYAEEWWHYTDTTDYPVDTDFMPPS